MWCNAMHARVAYSAMSLCVAWICSSSPRTLSQIEKSSECLLKKLSATIENMDAYQNFYLNTTGTACSVLEAHKNPQTSTSVRVTVNWIPAHDTTVFFLQLDKLWQIQVIQQTVLEMQLHLIFSDQNIGWPGDCRHHCSKRRFPWFRLWIVLAIYQISIWARLS